MKFVTHVERVETQAKFTKTKRASETGRPKTGSTKRNTIIAVIGSRNLVMIATFKPKSTSRQGHKYV